MEARRGMDVKQCLEAIRGPGMKGNPKAERSKAESSETGLAMAWENGETRAEAERVL
jgi:hypothetical protein